MIVYIYFIINVLFRTVAACQDLQRQEYGKNVGLTMDMKNDYCISGDCSCRIGVIICISG